VHKSKREAAMYIYGSGPFVSVILHIMLISFTISIVFLCTVFALDTCLMGSMPLLVYSIVRVHVCLLPFKNDNQCCMHFTNSWFQHGYSSVTILAQGFLYSLAGAEPCALAPNGVSFVDAESSVLGGSFVDA
jgi:hypothetical protein